MITAVTPENEARFLSLVAGDACAGLRIETAYRCYAAHRSVCGFYLAEEAALLLMGGTLLVCGRLTDPEELAGFCNFAGVREVEGGGLCPAGFIPQTRLLMKAERPSAMQTTAPLEEAPALWQLSRSGLLEADPEAWYADACIRRNHGFAEILAVREGECYVSTAGMYALRGDAAYLTAVATREDRRGRGYAGLLVAELAKRYANRTLCLLCAPALRRFYERLGFAVWGEIEVYQKTA